MPGFMAKLRSPDLHFCDQITQNAAFQSSAAFVVPLHRDPFTMHPLQQAEWLMLLWAQLIAKRLPSVLPACSHPKTVAVRLVWKICVSFCSAGLELDLNRRLHGQHLAKEVILRAVRGFLETPQPENALSLSFHGWSGTGKSFVARMIADHLYQDGLKSECVKVFISLFHFPHPKYVDLYKVRKLHCYQAQLLLVVIGVTLSSLFNPSHRGVSEFGAISDPAFSRGQCWSTGCGRAQCHSGSSPSQEGPLGVGEPNATPVLAVPRRAL